MLQHLAAMCYSSRLLIRWKNIGSSLVNILNILVYASINIITVHVAEHKLPFSYIRMHTRSVLKVCIVFR